jgi:hypothetical protein
MMKKISLSLVGGALAGFIASTVLTGCKSSGKGAASEPGGASTGHASSGQASTSHTATQKVQFLFVQNARDVTFENGAMTLRGVNPVTVCFADRPERIAGHMPTAKIVPMWGEGKDSFTADPPNATLSILSGDNVSNVVVELRNPRISADALTYDVRTLEGTPPAHGGACSLFIDIIGMPLTPFSYAGAARRAYRRGYMYPGYYGPAVVPVAPVVVAPRPVVIY